MVSMTGFGRARARGRSGAVTVEVRSVNARYLEVTCRLPEGWSALEETVRTLVERQAARGKVTVTVSAQGGPAVTAAVSLPAARRHLTVLRRLQRLPGVSGPITAAHLVTLPGVLVTATADAVSTWRAPLRQAASAAVGQWARTRAREGRALARALCGLVERFGRAVEALAARRPAVVREYRTRLAARIQALTAQALDPGRLEQEVALFATNGDITEELTRIRAHVAHLETLLRAAAPVGRTLEFVAQELQREINTVGSKANDVEVGRLAIQVKGWVEQLREQAQNVE